MNKSKHSIEEEISNIEIKIDYIKEAIDEIKEEVKDNTKFRNKATGIIGFVSFIFTMIGGIIVLVFGKIIK